MFLSPFSERCLFSFSPQLYWKPLDLKVEVGVQSTTKSPLCRTGYLDLGIKISKEPNYLEPQNYVVLSGSTKGNSNEIKQFSSAWKTETGTHCFPSGNTKHIVSFSQNENRVKPILIL